MYLFEAYYKGAPEDKTTFAADSKGDILTEVENILNLRGKIEIATRPQSGPFVLKGKKLKGKKGIDLTAKHTDLEWKLLTGGIIGLVWWVPRSLVKGLNIKILKG